MDQASYNLAPTKKDTFTFFRGFQTNISKATGVGDFPTKWTWVKNEEAKSSHNNRKFKQQKQMTKNTWWGIETLT